MEICHDLVKKQFLIRLEDKDFRNLCQVDKSFAKLCTSPSSENVYHERFKWWFREDLLQFKELGMTWKEFYNRVFDFMNKEHDYMYIYKLYANGKLIEIKILYHLETDPLLTNQTGANLAAKYGQLEILKWLALLNPPILPDDDGVDSAIENGQLKVLKWLAKL